MHTSISDTLSLDGEISRSRMLCFSDCFQAVAFPFIPQDLRRQDIADRYLAASVETANPDLSKKYMEMYDLACEMWSL